MKIYYFILAIFLSGCSMGSQAVIQKDSSNPIVIAKPTQTQQSYLPQWIMQTNSEKGYMCNIGSSALNNNMAISKKVAIIQAKANISQDIQSYINTQSKLQEKCINDECKSKFTSNTNISSTQMIRNIKITNHFTDTKKRIYYVQVCSKL